MEPTAILSLVSACLGVTSGAVSAVHKLYEARELYGDAKAAVQAIEIKLSTLKFTLTMLHVWTEQLVGPRSSFPGFVEQLSEQIQGCLGVISAVRAKIEFKQDLGRMDKARFVWNESSIRSLERALDSQVQALQTLLLVSQFTDVSVQREQMLAAETRSVLSVARETASAYESDLDTIATELAEREFDFDDKVVTSNVYRAAFRHQMTRRARKGELEKEPASDKEPDGVDAEVSGGSQHEQNNGEYRSISTNTHDTGEGGEHPDSLESIAKLSLDDQKQYRLAEAEKLQVRVMETRRRALGEEHPDTLKSIVGLASTYHKQDRWAEAEKLQVQVMETRKRMLGEEHSDTLSSMVELASTYRSQKQWANEEKLQVQVMQTRKRVLGEEHADTLDSMQTVALVYYTQGRYTESEKLEVSAMETRKRVLGEEHWLTLHSMSQLAHTYAKLGRWQEAEQLRVQEVEINKRVLGDEHPDTLESMSKLASIYSRQGR